MLLAGKTAWAGRSGPLPTPLASGANLSKDVPAVAHPDDIKKMQETLKAKDTTEGKSMVCSVSEPLASIRGFQKTENLPVTGLLDAQTAVKRGVRPEGREEVGYETTQDKPSAGIKRARGSGRTRKTLGKTAR